MTTDEESYQPITTAKRNTNYQKYLTISDLLETPLGSGTNDTVLYGS